MPGPRLLLCLLLTIASGFFIAGITWGLPSRDVDRYLFGDREPWTGPQVQMLADMGSTTPWDDRNRGADVDANPLRRAIELQARIEQGIADAASSTNRATQPTSAPTVPKPPADDGAIVVNSTDSARAEIVRRYRLFSYQPDEFITFASIAKMRPVEFDFDPRLYQYGGLWIYPIGFLLKAASVIGYVDLRGGGGGLAYYLDHPEAFGRFYVVARVYCAFWGVIAAWAVFAIVRRISGSQWAAFGAGLLFVTMPVVVNAAHEAKPHLPGLALTLLAVLAGARYVESGRLAHAIATGVLCGFAFGMVLSALPVFVLIPMMVLIRPMNWGDRTRVAIFAGLIGLAAYAITNPYVAIHLLRGGEGLTSNLGNSKAFYHVHAPIDGLINVGRLIIVGTSPALAAAGVLGVVVLGVRAYRTRGDTSPDATSRRAHGLLLAGPAILTAIQWALVGAGKPGEFGRFLLTTDVFLAVEAVVLIHSYVYAATTAVLLYGVVLLQTSLPGVRYLAGFIRDSGTHTSRTIAADQIEQARKAGVKRGIIGAEPAPYAVPPMNLWELEIVLAPRDTQPEAIAKPGDLVIKAEEGRRPISWANKPIKVQKVER